MIENYLKYHPDMDLLSDETLELLEKAVASTKRLVEVSDELSETNYKTRAAHAKSYGYVKGHFVAEKDFLTKTGLQDVFTDGMEVVIRFSNANNKIEKEKADFPAYGMSLKFGDEISYPLVNFPMLPVDDPDMFLKIFDELNEFRIDQAQNKSVAGRIPSMAGLMISSLFKINPLQFGNIVWKGIKLEKKFLFDYKYYGVGCYRFGDYVCKIQTLTKGLDVAEEIQENGNQFSAMTEFLKDRTLEIPLCIQFAVNEEQTPVNDLKTEWSVTDSPLERMGTIIIPPQTPVENSDELEKMAFNPFHNPEFLWPVGKLQQTRKAIYAASAEMRRAFS